MKRAVLLSGGMDSIALTYHLKPEIAYTINYGQASADRESYISKKVCQILGIEHKQIDIDCKTLGSGLLINQDPHTIAPSNEWWPFRNQLIITLGLMQGIKDQINEIHLALVKNDSFHKDGTKEFYNMINQLSAFQEGNIEVKCQTIPFHTHELVINYKVPFELLLLAHSCHVSNIACGKCPGCQKQLRVKQELKID